MAADHTEHANSHTEPLGTVATASWPVRRLSIGAGAAVLALLLLATLLPGAAAARSSGDGSSGAAESGTVTGLVFADANGDGVRDADEQPLPAITAIAYDGSGAEIARDITDDQGAVALDVVGPVRIEWSGWSDGLAPSIIAADNGGSVQFTTPDGEVGLGLTDPSLWCEANALLAITCPTTVGLDGEPVEGPAVAATADGPGTDPFSVSSADIGSTYGAAWHKASGSIYVGAFVKRHAPLGPLGTGGIYRIDTATGATAPVLDLRTLGIDTGADPHPSASDLCRSARRAGSSTGNCWFHDSDAASAVGRTGLGDLEVGADGSTLFAVDLANRNVIAVPITAGGRLDTTTVTRIPAPTGDCTDPAAAVPFGLDNSTESLLLGVTCTGPTTADLAVHVYALQGNVFAHLFGTPLDAPRPSAMIDSCIDCPADWQAWADDPAGLVSHSVDLDGTTVERITHAQPLLVDLDLSTGDLILGLRDRSGDLTARGMGGIDVADPRVYDVVTAGDVLRACDTDGDPATPGWRLESLGGCGARQTAGTSPEFHTDGPSTDGQPELFTGSIARRPLATAITAAALADSPAAEAFVTADWSDVDGSVSGIKPTVGHSATTTSGGGLGDIEFACKSAPTQIGDRVWLDTDADGVQDPSEPPIVGASVTATTIDGRIQSTRSDENGIFTLTVDAATSYEIVIDPSTVRPESLPDGMSTQDLTATLSNAAEDHIDSDIDIVGGRFIISATTGAPGEHLHHLDAGFVVEANSGIGGRVYFDRNRDGATDPTDPSASEIPVMLLRSDGTPATDASGAAVTTHVTGDGGEFLFDELPPGTYQLEIEAPTGFGIRDFLRSPVNGRLRSPFMELTAGDKKLAADAGLVLIGAAVHIEKSVNGEPADEPPGPTITPSSEVVFTYEVTNIGEFRIEGLLVFDDRQIQVDCPTDALDPGAAMVCVGQDMARTGDYTNTGLVTGQAVDGTAVSAEDTANYFGEVAEISITTYAQDQDANEPPGAGVVVGNSARLSYLATNQGNVELRDVVVLDDAGAEVSCPITTLTPGETMICFGRIEGTLGSFSTVGRVTARTATGQALSEADSAWWFGVDAGLAVTPTIGGQVIGETSPAALVEAGEPVVFGYQVSNTGNEPLTDLVLLEAGEPLICPTTELAPGATVSCQGGPRAAERGDVTRSATAVAGGPGGVALTADAVVRYTGTSSAFSTTTEAPQQVFVGSPATVVHAVTNTGGAELSDLLVVSDGGAMFSCETTTLAVAATTSCRHDQVVSGGGNPFTVTTTATSATGTVVSAIESITILGLETSVDVKSNVMEQPVAGSDVVINHVVRNDGTVPLDDLTVESSVGSDIICSTVMLEPGTATVCVGSARVTAGPNIVQITTRARDTAGQLIEKMTTIEFDGGPATNGTSECTDPDQVQDVTFEMAGGQAVHDLRRLRVTPGRELIMSWTGQPECTVSLAVYETGGDGFNPAYEQTLLTSRTCGADEGVGACTEYHGRNRLSIMVPTTPEHLQIDAILGHPLPSVGPVGGFYSTVLGEGRLISATNI